MENHMTAPYQLAARTVVETTHGTSEVGVWVLTPPIMTGALPAELARELHEAQERRASVYMNGTDNNRDGEPKAPVYVVYSAGTPIAWLLSDGTRAVPDVPTFTAAQKRHQRMIRAAWKQVAAE